MLRFLLCSFALLLAFSTQAQNLNGQWKGSFTSAITGEQDEYVLELQISGKTQVSGYSYTYFYENGFRYFTICRISGYLEEKSKTITVTEFEKVKGNIPPGIMDCLQVHTLTYFKSDSAESLEGSWKPAPGFDAGCGSGTTALSRKMLVHTKLPGKKPTLTGAPKRAQPRVATTGKPTQPSVATGKPTQPSAAEATPTRPSGSTAKPSKPPTKGPYAQGPGGPSHAHGDTAHARGGASHALAPGKNGRPPRIDSGNVHRLRMDTSNVPAREGAGTPITRPPANNTVLVPLPLAVRQRSSDILQTIDVSSPEVRIELYDDGVIDHDTVTVYFNGKTVVYKAMLKHQPIRVTLTVLPDRDNDLILYADNLGDIPPNTALMVVIAGEDRYDIRITSDEQKNGAIRFRLKKNKTP